MLLTVRKWGNSLAIRIPKSFAEDAGLADGCDVDLRLEDGKLVISPMPKKPPATLHELLAGITDDNLHSEADYGSPEGREAW